ncbi:Transposon Ty3-G Gag-Pol polyprotein [Araneus ventricosus]|uniref:RNA-directed DNA polymerase n=1 Tax=Araneus ventricosus TaxID=182803 RepID=A0A4Y2HTP0_ARAVE|nr:Transposon Ty3-G Gag-Pol polyprotein [Araneus ventricosus]
MYNDVFTGTLGKLVYTYDIKLTDNAVPRISAPRVIPVSLKEKVKAEIDKIVTNGVLEKVTEPIYWVHPIVVVQKPNKEVRICMDPRDRARKHGLKLSKDKSKIRVESVKYLGFDLSKNGQSINEDKIQALIEYETPKNKAELQRVLGIITFLVDASQYGLGAVLLQEDHPIAYESSSLTETQQRYSQIEKELLAIVIGCKKFHYYVYGTKFVIETDHKPLIGLLQKPMDKLSPRLQRMVLELFKYNLHLTHVPGKNLYVADALSRNPLKCHEDTSFLEAGAAVVYTVLTASDEKTEILKKAAKDDPVLSLIRNYIEEDWPANFKEVSEKAKPFWDKKPELHCYKELIFLGNRLVVPTQMKEEILQNLHSAHQGITSCINKASRNVYWPNFCEDIKNFVNSYSICQQHHYNNTSTL